MRLLFAVLWALIIAAIHAIPGQDLELIQFEDLFQLDKLFHLAVFSIGTLLLAQPMKIQYPIRWERYTIVVYLLYGFFLELCQEAFFSDRQADLLDWVADSLGVFLAIWLMRKITKLAPC